MFLHWNQIVSKLLILFLCSLEISFAYTQTEIQSVVTSKEDKIRKIRQEEIEQLQIVLARRSQESRRPDLLLRLAELYVEEYRFLFFKENEYYQLLLKKEQKPKKVEHNLSKPMLVKANQVCFEILKSRVPFNSMDKVYYFLAYNHQELGEDKKAMQFYEQLIREFPKSQFAAEAYRNLGEFFYNERQYQKAVFYLEKASQFSSVPSLPRTYYKLAWSYFRLRNYEKALSTMKAAIDKANSDEKFLSIKEDAIKDLVFFYSEAGEFDEAKRFFSTLPGGADTLIQALLRLAKTYESQGKIQNAMKINDVLFVEFSQKRPELAWEILMNNIQISEKINDESKKEKYIQTLIKYFSEKAEELSKAEDGKVIFLQAKNYIKNRATQAHKEAIKTKNQKIFLQAKEFYVQYLNNFLKNPKQDEEYKERAQIRVYISDVLLALKNENEAMPYLEEVLKDEKCEVNLRKEAGTALLNILIKRINSNLENKSKQTEWTSDEKLFFKISKIFEEVFPKDSLVAELKYKKARILALRATNEGLSEDALDALEELVEKYPNRDESLIAAQDIVQDYLKKGETKKAVKKAEEFLKNEVLMTTDSKSKNSNALRSWLKSVISRQEFEKVQNLEKEKEYLKAAIEYENLAKTAQDSEVIYKSFYNAAINYEKADALKDSFRVYLHLLDKYPDKLEKIKDYLKRILILEISKSEYVDAANMYLTLYRNSKFSEKEKEAFIQTSFNLYLGSNDIPNSLKLAKEVEEKICSNKVVEFCDEIFFEYIELLKSQKNYLETVNALKKYIANKSSRFLVKANYVLAQVYFETHDVNKGNFYLKNATQAYKNLKKSTSKVILITERKYAAQAAYLLVQDLINEFNNLKLELPEDKIKQITQKKLNLIAVIIEKLQEVVSLGDGEVALQSLVKIASLFSKFAEEIETAPIPERIKANADLLKTYNEQLKKISTPLRARAQDYLNQALKKGTELKLVSSAYRNMMRDVALMDPIKYPLIAYYENFEKFSIAQMNLETDLEHARKEVNAQLKENLKNENAWIQLGNIEVQLKRYRLARLAYEQALSLNSKNSAALNNLAIILELQGETLQAFDALIEAKKINEFDSTINKNLSKLYLQYRHYESAKDILAVLLKREPETKELAILYALARAGSGDLNYAYSELEKFKAHKDDRFGIWASAWMIRALNDTKKYAEDALDEYQEFLSKNKDNINFKEEVVDAQYAVKIIKKIKGVSHD
jgi:tetratricopeptide (TPR) repeat protein